MATFTPDYSDFYKQYAGAFLARPDVAADPDNHPPRWFARPGEIVVNKAEADTADVPLRREGFEPIRPFGYGRENQLETRTPLPFSVYKNKGLGNSAQHASHLRDLVVSLRGRGGTKRLAMNHLMGASPWIWVSAGPPTPLDPGEPRPAPPSGDAGACTTVGVV